MFKGHVWLELLFRWHLSSPPHGNFHVRCYSDFRFRFILLYYVYRCIYILKIENVLILQIHDEAKKFSYQTGVKVVVAYGGAPITQQVIFTH